MLSSWKKIFILGILAVTVFYGLNKLSENAEVGLVTPKFIEKRNDVAALLKKLAAAPDTNLTELGNYEQRKDFIGALNILRGVQTSNSELLGLVDTLVSKTESVVMEAEKIDDVVLRPQAILALKDLQEGNFLMIDYLRLRGEIFEELNKYYSDHVLRGQAVQPEVADDMVKLDGYVAKAKAAYDSFNQKIDLFDRAAGLK